MIPPWVQQATGVPPATLSRWRQRGWLTPPGRPFDWQAALPQIGWLARLQWQRRFVPDAPINDPHPQLDAVDAAGGWRLRQARARYAVRVDRGPWEPADTPSLAAERLAAGAWHVALAHVNGAQEELTA